MRDGVRLLHRQRRGASIRRTCSSEIERLEAIGVDVRSRLFISESCPLILPFHVEVDKAREALRETSGAGKIGTTGKGIGPAYEDKVARRALRVQDLKHPRALRDEAARAARAAQLRARRATCTSKPLEFQPIFEHGDAGGRAAQADDGRRRLHALQRAPRPAPTSCSKARRARCSTSTTAPIRTSPRATAWPATPPPARASGPDLLHYILGITKAYTTRVGSGPFPTELPIDVPGTVGHHLSTVGQERGTVTGRPRRCGWLDAALLKRSIIINGISGLCITKLDVLDGLAEIKVCVGYELDGERIDILPLDADDIVACVPIYETFPGWTESTVRRRRAGTRCRSTRGATSSACEELIGAPIDMVSTGPDRDHTILLRHPYQPDAELRRAPPMALSTQTAEDACSPTTANTSTSPGTSTTC